MNDEELEMLLRRHRPAGPPPELRERILSSAADSRRTWPWAAAAAALLVCAIALQLAARDLRRELRSGAGAEPAAGTLQAEMLRVEFGLDEDTARAVQLALELQRRREASETSSGGATWP